MPSFVAGGCFCNHRACLCTTLAGFDPLSGVQEPVRGVHSSKSTVAASPSTMGRGKRRREADATCGCAEGSDDGEGDAGAHGGQQAYSSADIDGDPLDLLMLLGLVAEDQLGQQSRQREGGQAEVKELGHMEGGRGGHGDLPGKGGRKGHQERVAGAAGSAGRGGGCAGGAGISPASQPQKGQAQQPQSVQQGAQCAVAPPGLRRMQLQPLQSQAQASARQPPSLAHPSCAHSSKGAQGLAAAAAAAGRAASSKPAMHTPLPTLAAQEQREALLKGAPSAAPPLPASSPAKRQRRLSGPACAPAASQELLELARTEGKGAGRGRPSKTKGACGSANTGAPSGVLQGKPLSNRPGGGGRQPAVRASRSRVHNPFVAACLREESARKRKGE